MYATPLCRTAAYSGCEATCSSATALEGLAWDGAQDVVPSEYEDEVVQLLEHCPEAVGLARQTARVALRSWQMSAATTDMSLLVVSELVTNAVEHAKPPLAMHVGHQREPEQLWVGVTDGGPARQPGEWTSSCSRDEHGRGLHIVGSVSDAHGVTFHEVGITRWARLAAR
ncbi:ATP-binding protein [Streptomyces wuyuanensis]|uniref:ATP-binding protein n=1 Tax=Streptomyces wuyuanensis TaxID=1196353 RepID=UPI003441D85F